VADYSTIEYQPQQTISNMPAHCIDADLLER